ncbi:Uncharacterised protein [Vibrio cholerae]|uniref:Uncharacterized protein n=1 Tax=Vibrio cholerae TaxID=666 RepID=A0A655PS58_VIBCL|nr:Uncharacterised protein [Vibrio cholerae]CSA23119.1 Uncharacterised protein [Vibrio cholerae]CSA25477.1 Uncharacterised protein [Vibrio cholerae]CSA25589.1 Uncharacterised protein [Vibrio cholerae]CSA33974.1 Uncharacterised protein [Vibrio cholerae]
MVEREKECNIRQNNQAVTMKEPFSGIGGQRDTIVSVHYYFPYEGL